MKEELTRQHIIIGEYKKALEKLMMTDPSTMAYHTVLQSIEFLNGMAETICAVELVVNGDSDMIVPDGARMMEAPEDMRAPTVVDFKPMVPTADEPADLPPEAAMASNKEEPEVHADAPAPEKKYTKADLRSALYNAKEEGVNITELLGKYGAKTVNDVKEADYAEIVGMYGGA